jgi:hypothetical protein
MGCWNTEVSQRPAFHHPIDPIIHQSVTPVSFHLLSTEIFLTFNDFPNELNSNNVFPEYRMPTAETLQIKLDNELAKTLQSNAEAQELGITEFVRRAVRFYLRLGEEMEIRRQYQKGYGEADLTELALEMKDWEEEQVWPES